MPIFEDGELGSSVRAKINAAITTVDNLDTQGVTAAANYETRQEFVDAVAGGLSISNGGIVHAAGIKHKAVSGDTSIGDLPGFVISDADMKTQYEGNPDTNAFTDADESKLDNVSFFFDEYSEMVASTYLTVGDFTQVNNGYNEEPEVFEVVTAATFTANGATVRDLTGITGQAVSTRKWFATYAEFIADTRTFSDDTDLGAVSFSYKAVPSGGDATNAGGQEFEVQVGENGYDVKSFGATGDGVTDDQSAISAAITKAAGVVNVHFPSATYNISTTLEMPLKLSGVFTIDGDIIWSFKKEVIQVGQVTATGQITIDSVWVSRFYHLECSGNFLIQSSSTQWGNFWNDFGQIRCAGELIIDVDQDQSTNQNNFQMVKPAGGLRIRGVNTTGTREAHSNTFYGIDTTGANMTAADGSTGHHVLNESDLNQTNTIIAFYGELTGNRTITGNWNVLGDMVDANNPAFVGERENYRLGSRMQGRQSSYLPVTPISLASGSDWGVLNGVGRPSSLSGLLSTVQLSAISSDAENSPDHSFQGAQSVGGGTFRAIDISYKLTDVSRVHATAFVYQEGTPETSVEVLDASGSVVTSGAGSYVPLGGNWYLLRVSGNGDTVDQAAGDTEGKIRVYTTQGSALTASDFRIMTSFFVTSEAITPLPSIKLGRRECISSSVPTNGQWNAGDVTYDDTPANGSNLGWVCTTAGVPGTWAAFGAIRDANAYTLTNVTTDRAFDADTVAISELADVVGTLVNDLKNMKILS